VQGTAGALEFRLDEKEIGEIESFFKDAASA
jgi:hypothetical protein